MTVGLVSAMRHFADPEESDEPADRPAWLIAVAARWQPCSSLPHDEMLLLLSLMQSARPAARPAPRPRSRRTRRSRRARAAVRHFKPGDTIMRAGGAAEIFGVLDA